MSTIRRVAVLIGILAAAMVIYPSAASSQTSSACAAGERAYTMHNVNPNAQEVTISRSMDYKLHGTLQRVLIERQANGKLDYTLCLSPSKPARSKTPIVAVALALVAIAGVCIFVRWLRKRPPKTVFVDLV